MFTDDGAFAGDGFLGAFLPLAAFVLWVGVASVALARADRPAAAAT
jgi:hypothetical protein